jgi:hypothetical protein
MSLARRFNRRLDDLWHARTAGLRALVVPRKQGRPVVLTKRLRQKLTDDLLETATDLLLRREGKEEFHATLSDRMRRHIKGRGVSARYDRLIGWARERCAGPIVYVFWQGRQCLYVGKGKSWRRLRNYAKSVYLAKATRLDVFCMRGKSYLGKAECLATHLFAPRDNKKKPARSKWGKACPICKKHDQIRAELAALFRLR